MRTLEPKFSYFGSKISRKLITADFAVLIALLPNPDTWSSVRKSNIFTTDGWNLSIDLLPQNLHHFMKYVPFCFWVLPLQEDKMIEAVCFDMPSLSRHLIHERLPMSSFSRDTDSLLHSLAWESVVLEEEGMTEHTPDSTTLGTTVELEKEVRASLLLLCPVTVSAILILECWKDNIHMNKSHSKSMKRHSLQKHVDQG